MNSQKALLENIEKICFKGELVNILAYEQRISIEEALDWIVEYKKFLFLLLDDSNKDELYPSRYIREVWHLHMYFLEDYKRDVLSLKRVKYQVSQIDLQEDINSSVLYEETLKRIKSISNELKANLWPEQKSGLESELNFSAT